MTNLKQIIILITFCAAFTSKAVASEQTDCTIPAHTTHQLCSWNKLTDSDSYGSLIPQLKLISRAIPNHKLKISRTTLNENFVETQITQGKELEGMMTIIPAAPITNQDHYYRVYVDNYSNQPAHVQIIACSNYPSEADYTDVSNWDCGS